MANEQFTGESLVDALRKGALTPAPPAGVSIVGMVKLSEAPACVAFTPAGCESWVDIPVAIIESAQHLGERQCADHRHSVVKITLKESTDAEGRVLRQLLGALSQAPRLDAARLKPPVRNPFGAGPQSLTAFPTAPGTAAASCHNFCDNLLRACIRNPNTTSAQCVFLYENCWRVCDGIDWFGGFFDVAVAD